MRSVGSISIGTALLCFGLVTIITAQQPAPPKAATAPAKAAIAPQASHPPTAERIGAAVTFAQACQDAPET